MKKNQVNVKIEFSIRNLLKIFAVVVLILFLFKIRDVLVMLFLAFILSSTLLPLIDKLSTRKIPRWLSASIVYTLTILIFLTVISVVSVPLIKESIKFLDNLPNVFESVAKGINNISQKFGLNQTILDTQIIGNSISEWVNNLSSDFGNLLTIGSSGLTGIFRFISNLFGGVIVLFSVITISLYISIDHKNFLNLISSEIPDKKMGKKICHFVIAVENKLGKWLTGQFILSIMFGLFTWIFLSILKVPYALPLALIAAILDPVPNFGATLAIIPSAIIALASGNFIIALIVVAGMTVYQQIENQFFVPTIMGNAVGLPPIMIIISILVGANLYGLIGILLAVPMTAILHIGIDYWITNTKD